MAELRKFCHQLGITVQSLRGRTFIIINLKHFTNGLAYLKLQSKETTKNSKEHLANIRYESVLIKRNLRRAQNKIVNFKETKINN